jgi:hypothetical protein
MIEYKAYTGTVNIKKLAEIYKTCPASKLIRGVI